MYFSFIMVNTKRQRGLAGGISIITTSSGFIRGSLCSAVGWQVCATFPRSWHKLGHNYCEDTIKFLVLARGGRKQIHIFTWHADQGLLIPSSQSVWRREKNWGTALYWFSKKQEGGQILFSSGGQPKHLLDSGGELWDELQAVKSINVMNQEGKKHVYFVWT